MSRVGAIPQVVRVRDLFQQNETAYIVMDFIEGETLMARLKRNGPLSWEDAQSIFLPAIRAMEQVHQAGLVHRDLSPDNLMITSDGTVQILDLGAAKDLNINAGASSMQVTKSGFSPLEQYSQRGSSGTWTDVYALAATMYYSLTGVLPPNAVDRVDEDPIRWDLAPLTALPPNVLTALKQAMALSSKTRTQSMGEFLKQLEKAERKPSPKVTPPPNPEKGKPEPKGITDRKNQEEASESDDVLIGHLNDESLHKWGKRFPILLVAVLVLVVLAEIVIFTKPAPDTASASGPKKEAQSQTEALTDTFPPTEPESTLHLSMQEQTISAGVYHTVAIKPDGSAVGAGSREYNRLDVSDWTDLVAISVSYDTIGLKADGTVVATGPNNYGQCDVSGWTDIVTVTAGQDHTIGLKADGTVVATGRNDFAQCDISDWKGIVAVSAGTYHTAGLKADGTVVSTGDNVYGQCDVSDWKDIVAISAGKKHTVGLKADGTVVYTGDNVYGQCDVSDWKDIMAISAGVYHTVGLKADGSVVSTTIKSSFESDLGQCNVSTWTDIRIPGHSISIPDEQLKSEYTDVETTFQLDNGKRIDASIAELSAPLTNCNAITVCVEINELISGNIEGEWGLWVRQLDGEWILAGTFDLEGASAYARLEFDRPISFDAWTCPCHCLGDYWNFSLSTWLQDATQFHYTWER